MRNIKENNQNELSNEFDKMMKYKKAMTEVSVALIVAIVLILITLIIFGVRAMSFKDIIGF